MDHLVSVTALSSGYHIGSSNWLMKIGAYTIGLLRNSSEETEYRHPTALNTTQLQDLDVLIVGSVARAPEVDSKSLTSQINQFYDRLTSCLMNNPHAKVLLPVNAQFILEIVDLLLHKTSDRIVFISDAAN